MSLGCVSNCEGSNKGDVMQHLLIPFVWLWRVCRRVETAILVRSLNKNIPKLHQRMQQAGYPRHVRRRLLTKMLKNMQIAASGSEVEGVKL